MGGPRRDDATAIHVSVFLAPGSARAEQVRTLKLFACIYVACVAAWHAITAFLRHMHSLHLQEWHVCSICLNSIAGNGNLGSLINVWACTVQMQSKDESEILLQNQLHTLLFGRPDGTPTDLELCLSDDGGKITFLIQVDCVVMYMECVSSVLDAMSVATKKALTTLDITALNTAITSSAESENFSGIHVTEYYAEVAKLPSIVSTGQVRCIVLGIAAIALLRMLRQLTSGALYKLGELFCLIRVSKCLSGFPRYHRNH